MSSPSLSSSHRLSLFVASSASLPVPQSQGGISGSREPCTGAFLGRGCTAFLKSSKGTPLPARPPPPAYISLPWEVEWGPNISKVKF